MAIPSTPHDWTSGEYVTTANMDNIKDWLVFLANPPACRLYHNTNQSASNSSLSVLVFNSERYDTASMHNNVSNNSRITITNAGVYTLFGHADFASNATGKRSLGLLLNGATYIGELTVPAVNGADTTLSVVTTYKLAEGDYVELYVNQTSGGALNVISLGDPYQHTVEFGATWIGIG